MTHGAPTITSTCPFTGFICTNSSVVDKDIRRHLRRRKKKKKEKNKKRSLWGLFANQVLRPNATVSELGFGDVRDNIRKSRSGSSHPGLPAVRESHPSSSIPLPIPLLSPPPSPPPSHVIFLPSSSHPLFPPLLSNCHRSAMWSTTIVLAPFSQRDAGLVIPSFHVPFTRANKREGQRITREREAARERRREK